VSPRTRRSAGLALALTLAVLALVSLVGLIVWARLHEERLARPAEEHRTQALWLARSAAAAGRPLQREVPLGGGAATLVVRGAAGKTVAEVRMPRWGTARVTVAPGQPWEERWERAR
jgi:hypothetical protein